MTDKFDILRDYPPEGPPIPERSKIIREKDHHEPGNGRRDKTKRGGRGPSNWGDPKDDAKYLKDGVGEEEEEEEEVEEDPLKSPAEKAPPVSAAKYFQQND